MAFECQAPWFELIREGKKTVEGRLGTTEDFKHILNDKIMFRQESKKVEKRVVELRHYKTLEEYLSKEWKFAAPQCSTLEDAIVAYEAILDSRQETVFCPIKIGARGGIVAIVLGEVA